MDSSESTDTLDDEQLEKVAKFISHQTGEISTQAAIRLLKESNWNIEVSSISSIFVTLTTVERKSTNFFCLNNTYVKGIKIGCLTTFHVDKCVRCSGASYIFSSIFLCYLIQRRQIKCSNKSKTIDLLQVELYKQTLDGILQGKLNSCSSGWISSIWNFGYEFVTSFFAPPPGFHIFFGTNLKI